MAIFRGDGGAGDANTDVTINSVTEKANEASTSASEAASSATSASTSASNASTSETNASNSATGAASSASSASTSASNASTSASTASTQATNASNSATAAASSATAAATSETNAETAETNAETAETNAASSASTATTKASEAATSATNAATSATTATTKASEASTSATNAATSATTASTQATNASNSASAASTSETNAATSATNAANSATDAANTLSSAALKANNLSDLANASTARDNLGLTIGTDVQGYSSVLANTTASFLTADESKLDGIEASADVTDTTNVTSAGALMDSEVTNLAQVKAFDTTDYATAAQGTTADNALAASAVSTFGGTLIDDADASTARTTLGLGDVATTAASAYATAAQGTKADNAAAKASNLSDLANVSTARDNLGVQINDDVIGYVTPSTSGNVLTSNGSAWTSAAISSISGNLGIGATPNEYGGFTALTIGHETNGGLIDLEINGTVKGEMFVTSSALGFQSIQSDDDIIFKGNDGGNTITALTLDMSAAGTAIFNNDVYFGTSVVQGQGGCTFQHGARGYNQTFNQSSHANNNEFITFRNQNTQIGSITTPNASSTSYNTSSDYRLKQNVDYDWNATTECKKLKPCRFKWISDVEIEDGGGATASVVTGFLAHELQAVVPEAASGVKDETEEYINDDGDSATRIKPQGIDQSKIIAILTKTIQELEARITALEG